MGTGSSAGIGAEGAGDYRPRSRNPAAARAERRPDLHDSLLRSERMADLFSAEHLAALVTLTALEIVLGIDNIVFIAILCGRLPPDRREVARRLGLFLAMFARIGLLLGIGWLSSLTKPLVPIKFQVVGEVLSHEFTGRDLILVLGGLFLVAKATLEIHHKLEGAAEQHGAAASHAGFGGTLVQIVLLDIVFSLDSVITAV